MTSDFFFSPWTLMMVSILKLYLPQNQKLKSRIQEKGMSWSMRINSLLAMMPRQRSFICPIPSGSPQSNCYSLTSVTIPDSVSQIDDRAFIYCYALTSLAIPRSVKRIGSDVVEECDRLTIYGEVGSAAEAVGSGPT